MIFSILAMHLCVFNRIEYPQDMLANYIERLMNKCLDELIRSGCIELKEAQQAPQGAAVKKKHLEKNSFGVGS